MYKVMNKKLFVGIDFSKETFDAAILKVSEESSIDLKIIGNEQFKNDVPGCKRFVKWLNKTCALAGDYSSVLVGGEDTGNYSITLPKQLYVLGIDCSLQNAYSIKCGSGKIVRDKTDKMDAEKIAYYFYRFRDQIRLYKPLSKDMESLERLYSYRYGQVRERARLKCQIKEYKHILKSEPNDETLKFMIQRLEKQERFLKREIKAIEAKMVEIIKANEELNEIHKCLLSVPGIGKITSLLLIVVTRGFTRFDNPKQLACFLGVSPHPNQSGTSVQNGNHRSWFADPYFASLLHMAALSASRFNSKFIDYKKKLKSKGKPHLLIMNNIKNKLLTVAFTIATRRTKFYSDYDAKRA